ncbi:flagellar hook-associated protein FlgK [Sphingomonas mucosissima]|uniref:Flagellar hook-associated protein 1 n=1 Tax=Sphingomonas mucosissima TaxID=370959 RepID=A0A245ZF35_9SPHN|nr:flagellar basal body rod C-terminal domain-containing protein [Sphingomonas mucosissima]OWK28338.1 flagellar hook-associated protein 1 [Sphingomonas mucosissima]
MSLSDILGSALSGLGVSQAALRTVSNNIANVSTPGYARQRVSISTGVTAGQVNGVIAGEPHRIADRFLEGTVYRRAGDMGRADVTANYLDRLQSLLGAPGDASGLPARLDAISSSAIAMTAAPGSPQSVAVFTANVDDAITTLQQLDRDVSGLRGDVESEVGYTVDRINGLLKQIHDLNDTVSRLSGTGRSAAGVEDQRMIAVEELGGLMKVVVRPQPDGRLALESASGAVVLDKRLRQLAYPVSGEGVSQPVYPVIDLRFADSAGQAGASTGEKLDSPAVGGRLGGLLDVRDRALPEFSEKLGALFAGMAETLNAVSNANTSVPPPAGLEGRATPLVGSDRLGFTGAATFAVTKADGTLVAKTRIDFDALGAGATVNDAIAAINAGLGGAAIASFGANGTLSFRANGSGNGVVVAQDGNAPSDRGGLGFSHYFGLNDLVRSDRSTLGPSGFAAQDPHGFGTGETAEIVLRDSTGRVLTRHTLTGSGGPSFGDLATELNASPLGQFGTFAIDDRGRFRFEPDAAVPGASLSIPSDSTNRLRTGLSFSAISSLTGAAGGLALGKVRPEILNDATRLPLARFQADAAVGQKALGAADIRGATAFAEQLGKARDLGKDGVVTLDRFSSLLLGRAGTQAAQAASTLSAAAARRDDAVNRRDSYAGVNIDEELAQMVVFQNSYSAAARVITTASEMYDTLLGMIR